MKIKEYSAPGSPMASAYGNEGAHHWIIDVNGEEYLQLIGQLRNTSWNQRVAWYPKFFPGKQLGESQLEAHIVVSDDRDATMVRLLL